MQLSKATYFSYFHFFIFWQLVMLYSFSNMTQQFLNIPLYEKKILFSFESFFPDFSVNIYWI